MLHLLFSSFPFPPLPETLLSDILHAKLFFLHIILFYYTIAL